MAEAIIFALRKKGTQRMDDITIFDVNTERLQFIKDEYNVKITDNLDEAVHNANITILAVKPQNVDSVAQSLSEPLPGLLLSIVAGCTIDKLEKSFKTDKVVRSMPNTPAMVLEAITVWTATRETNEDMLNKTRALLGSIGEQVEVKDESYIDMATAVSGSGPAVSSNSDS